MQYDPTKRDDYYRSLLTNPGERGSVDYKAAIRLADKDSGSLNLLRHILGMANSGGGTIVIGYKEDEHGRFVPDPDHSDEVCQLYDTTKLANRMNRLVLRTDEKLVVYVNQITHPETQIVYPVIHVDGFTKRPFFCRSRLKDNSGNEILSQNAIYIRRSAAETVPLTHPDDWNALIDRCMQMRRDEFLQQFRDLASQMGPTISGPQVQTRDPSPDELLRRLEDLVSRMGLAISASEEQKTTSPPDDSREWQLAMKDIAIARFLRSDGTLE